MTDLTEVRRAKFEAIWPMPDNCIWCGNGYAATSYNAFSASDYAQRWKGFSAALDSVVVELPAKISPHNTSDAGYIDPRAVEYDECIDECRDAIHAAGALTK